MQGSSSKFPKVGSWEEERDILSNHVKQKARGDRVLNILDAGCGIRCGLNLEGIQYMLTGVDIDKTALDIRKNQQGDLHIAILGDLCTVTLKENEYDVIYNSFVLEHVDGAEGVLSNFIQWLRPGGILLLKIPDRDCVFGFLSRIAPFWFHVFFKKRIQGVKNAGKPGYPPFPTFYDKVVSRNGIHEFCEKHGLIIRAEYGITRRYKDHAFFWLLVSLLVRLIHIISLGRLASDHGGLMYVIEKPQIMVS